MEIVLDTSIRK